MYKQKLSLFLTLTLTFGILFGNTALAAGSLVIEDDAGGESLTITTAAETTTYTLTFPGAVGSANDVLIMGAGGALSYGTLGSDSITDGSIAFGDLDSSDILTTVSDDDTKLVTAGAVVDYVASELGAITYDEIGDPGANAAIAFGTNTNSWTSTSTASDFFSITNTAAMGDVSVMKLEHNTGDATDGTMFEIVNTDADIDSIVAPNFVLTNAGNIDAEGTLNVAGNTTLQTALTVSAGGATITGNSSVTGDFDTTGALTGGTIASDGTLTSGGALTVSAGGASITGNSTVTGDLDITAAGTVGSTFDVTGLATFSGGIAVDGGTVNVDVTSDFSDNVVLSGTATLSVAGLSTLTGGFLVDGNTITGINDAADAGVLDDDDAHVATSAAIIDYVAAQLSTVSSAYDDITAPDANSTIAFGANTNTWTSSATASDFFSITSTGAHGDVSVMKLEHNTGDATDGTMFEIVNTDADIDSIVAPNFVLTNAGNIDAEGTLNVAGNTTLQTALTVSAGGAAITGNSSVTGDFDTTGALTGGTIASDDTLDVTGVSTLSGGVAVDGGTVDVDVTSDFSDNVVLSGTATLSVAGVSTLTGGFTLDSNTVTNVNDSGDAGSLTDNDATIATSAAIIDYVEGYVAGAGATTLDQSYNAGNTIGLDATNGDLAITVDADENANVTISTSASTTTLPTGGLLALDNADTDTTLADGIVVSATGAITDALDLSAANIVNAINIGANTILGTGGAVIDFDNFDVDASGNLTAVSVTSTSDVAFKENIETVQNPIDTLLALRGVTWNWKDGLGFDTTTKSSGVIAQELEAAGLDYMVKTDADGHKSVAYNQLAGVLIEAGKAQQSEIEELQARLERLETLLFNVASAQ